MNEIEPVDWFDHFSKPMLEKAQEHFYFDGKDISILDLACGKGFRTSFFNLESGSIIVGIDINAEQLKKARKGVLYVNGDIECLPFKDHSFDAIFSFSAMQYVDWRSVVAKSEKLLKPNGKAVFVENLSGNIFAKVYRLIHRCLGWQYVSYQIPRKHIKFKELSYFKSIFEQVEVTPFHFLTPVSLIVPALRKGFLGKPLYVQSPNLYRALNEVDKSLISRFPWLSQFCWHVAICVTKGKK